MFPTFRFSKLDTGAFGAALLIPFHDTMEFPNGCMDIWRQMDNKLMGNMPKYVRLKYKVSRRIFNCSISDWQWPVCFPFVLTSMPVVWRIVASRRVVSRPGSTTCRILASIYVTRGIRPDTVPKSHAIIAFVPPSITRWNSRIRVTSAILSGERRKCH